MVIVIGVILVIVVSAVVMPLAARADRKLLDYIDERIADWRARWRSR
jgi:hypothetical protein